jgi:hypothetical protein
MEKYLVFLSKLPILIKRQNTFRILYVPGNDQLLRGISFWDQEAGTVAPSIRFGKEV